MLDHLLRRERPFYIASHREGPLFRELRKREAFPCPQTSARVWESCSQDCKHITRYTINWHSHSELVSVSAVNTRCRFTLQSGICARDEPFKLNGTPGAIPNGMTAVH